MRCATCNHEITQAEIVERSARSDAEGRPLWEMWQGDSLALLAQLHEWMTGVARVLVEGGVLLSFIDWRNFSEMNNAASTAGLITRSVVVWDKGRGSRPHKGGFRRQSEFICWATRGSMRAWADVYLDGVLRYATIVNGKVHITQKPVALMRELIQITPQGGYSRPVCRRGHDGRRRHRGRAPLSRHRDGAAIFPNRRATLTRSRGRAAA